MSKSLRPGLYEALVNHALVEAIATAKREGLECFEEAMDPGDSHETLARYVFEALLRNLRELPSDEKIMGRGVGGQGHRALRGCAGVLYWPSAVRTQQTCHRQNKGHGGPGSTRGSVTSRAYLATNENLKLPISSVQREESGTALWGMISPKGLSCFRRTPPGASVVQDGERDQRVSHLGSQDIAC